ncbi:MAG: diaminopimelate decarboxylase [Pseudomonadota bacterium]
MDAFPYEDGQLMAEGVALARIAAEVGSPVYVYSSAALVEAYGQFTKGLGEHPHLICYAMKANSNQAVIATLAEVGAGMDVVSGGEYARARAAGVPGARIVFSGVGKTREEMAAALIGGVRQFNVESEPELTRLSEVASGLGVTAPITLRVNPDVDAKTHEKIATGKAENKFGVPISRAQDVYAQAARLPGLQVVGIDVHIGSQLVDLEPFRLAYRKVAELTAILRADGHAIDRLDLGGGLGIPYERSNVGPPHPADFCAMVLEEVGHLGCEVELEPGRFIAGNAGVLISEVIYVKDGEDRQFLILDAAMNDLIRPAMYGAHHDVLPLAEPRPDARQASYDIVGPVCESGDTFAKRRAMPALAAGDLVAFRSAGAYGAVMSSEYNTRPLIPEVLVRGDQFAVIRPRPTFDEIINRDRLAPWLGESR